MSEEMVKVPVALFDRMVAALERLGDREGALEETERRAREMKVRPVGAPDTFAWSFVSQQRIAVQWALAPSSTFKPPERRVIRPMNFAIPHYIVVEVFEGAISGFDAGEREKIRSIWTSLGSVESAFNRWLPGPNGLQRPEVNLVRQALWSLRRDVMANIVGTSTAAARRFFQHWRPCEEHDPCPPEWLEPPDAVEAAP